MKQTLHLLAGIMLIALLTACTGEGYSHGDGDHSHGHSHDKESTENTAKRHQSID